MPNKKKVEPLPFRQDIIGILLIALSIFILVSNLSTSTGPVGLYLVKKILRSGVGVGVYALPFFLALIGVVIMIRSQIAQLTGRLLGLLLLFFTFVASAEVVKSETGGLIGYGIKTILERTIGPTGAIIALSASGVIGLLLLFNTTVAAILSLFWALITRRPKKKPRRIIEEIEEKRREIAEKRTIPAMIPVLKEMPRAKRVSVREPRYAGEYQLPPLDLLDLPSAREKQREEKLRELVETRKEALEKALASFGVAAKVVAIHIGPAVTRFEVQPEPGIKVSRILSLSDDIALNLAAQGVRIEAPIPGKSVIGIEVPNASITPVRLGEITRTEEFQKDPSKLLIALGKDLSGTPIFGDLDEMPHLLIAGTTGSGKSVCINALISSILLRARPDEVKFVMIDPKMVELTNYNDIPHLLAPVVHDPKRAAITLKEWVTREMDRRYKEFFAAGVRNIEGYNEKVESFEKQEKAVSARGLGEEAFVPKKLPYIVVIVDELADLMMVAAAEVEITICRLAQMARATGIHLVIATQRPSVDIITGLIKANIPSRISFAVATQVDSRVILDQAGAEKLLGKGDMLYHPVGAMKPIRLQGTFVSDEEVEKVVSFIKKQAPPEYEKEIMELKLEAEAGLVSSGERDALFAEAARLIVEGGQASVSHLQRRLRIGYNRAARLMDELEAAGIVSPPEGDTLRPRRVLASRETLKSLGID